jgi:hypothetical protein
LARMGMIVKVCSYPRCGRFCEPGETRCERHPKPPKRTGTYSRNAAKVREAATFCWLCGGAFDDPSRPAGSRPRRPASARRERRPLKPSGGSPLVQRTPGSGARRRDVDAYGLGHVLRCPFHSRRLLSSLQRRPLQAHASGRVRGEEKALPRAAIPHLVGEARSRACVRRGMRNAGRPVTRTAARSWPGECRRVRRAVVRGENATCTCVSGLYAFADAANCFG